MPSGYQEIYTSLTDVTFAKTSRASPDLGAAEGVCRKCLAAIRPFPLLNFMRCRYAQRVKVRARYLSQAFERGIPACQELRQRDAHLNQEFVEGCTISHGRAGGERERHLALDDWHGKGKF